MSQQSFLNGASLQTYPVSITAGNILNLSSEPGLSFSLGMELGGPWGRMMNLAALHSPQCVPTLSQ